jgi:hypothetical protein
MNIWNKRVPEIAYLLNPAFCSSIIYHVILEYQKRAKREFPFTLVYLILPIVLHKSTRERITSRTNMVVWIQKYPDVLVGFPRRAKSLVPFSNEAVEFLLQLNILEIVHGELSVVKTISKTKIKAITDQEILECYNKAEHVGRWFAQMGAEENIYAVWGVKP